jgi:hypothetical protein
MRALRISRLVPSLVADMSITKPACREASLDIDFALNDGFPMQALDISPICAIAPTARFHVDPAQERHGIFRTPIVPTRSRRTTKIFARNFWCWSTRLRLSDCFLFPLRRQFVYSIT